MTMIQTFCNSMITLVFYFALENKSLQFSRTMYIFLCFVVVVVVLFFANLSLMDNKQMFEFSPITIFHLSSLLLNDT